ncbi:hypothetical protein ASPNIDRAFT_52061 [Aspergillus niger ATCC 1015]|uniref:alpha,alpha-trehalase n=2 Tax=Aspergillus niger TaxID=5061 RepID=G3XQT1_ASPNA|nr:hypothetical protein ASPNIDRAFT_52061 [Aspergillus niger ATCC 1015]KAI2994187.1 CAZyme family GH65 [Aspergillus niger]TPR11960.1 Hemerythrin HHE cation binding domain family protein [Aspergillus niger]SPB44538.1 unnamed protein product [Aspergillus niger]
MQVKFLATLLPLLLHLPAAVDGLPGKNARISASLKRHAGRDVPQTALNSTNVYQTKFSGVTWDEDHWLLTTTTPDQGHYQSRGSVANGYLGINVANIGPFFELDEPVNGDVINGWPLYSRRQSFATISGFWDRQAHTNGSNFPWLSQYGDDSVISGVPHWSGLILDLGDDTYLDANVDNRTISNFKSTYDFKSGVLSWSYTWTPQGNKGSYAITYRLFAHKLYVNRAVVDMEITPLTNGNATVVNVLDGYAAVRTDFVASGQEEGAIFSAVRPWGVNNVTAYVYATLDGSDSVDLSSRRIVTDKPYVSTNSSSVAQAVDVTFTANETVRITKFVGGATTDYFLATQETAKAACLAGLADGYVKSLQSHVGEWATIMHDHSVDRFTDPATGKLPEDSHIVDSAIIAVTNTYYLLQNTAGTNAIVAAGGIPVNVDSCAPGGLTSDSYGGQIFWDADLWMQPGLVASHPESAQRFTNYRIALHYQAQANIETAFTGSKNQTSFSSSAAIYPWTSGRFGNCTATGPCWDYQYHLNGDIGLAMINQWVASGDTAWFKNYLFPIYDAAATLYSELVERNGSSWTLTNMTDPDEYANSINAGGYTMPLIAETLQNANKLRKQFGLEPNETWDEIAEDVLILRENGVTLEYTSMNGSAVVKQADIVLNTFPLTYESDNYTATNSLTDLDYYANKQSADGPAMTYAIFAIVASDVSPSGCSAFTYHQYSYAPYARGPWYQLSEQMIDDASINGGTHPAFPFLTGHGGANQVALYGYLGLRLHPDDTIYIDPNLPPQIPHITYRTFYWHGWPISAWSNYTHTTIKRDSSLAPLASADLLFSNVSIKVQVGQSTASADEATIYYLPLSGELTVPNRMIGSVNTTPGNQVQCHPVYSPDAYEPGQFPISAVDGATSTKWQPSTSDLTSLTVTLSTTAEAGAEEVSGFYFDWSQAPPENLTVIFHDSPIGNPSTVFAAAGSNSTGYRVITSMSNIVQSKPYNAISAEELNVVSIPTANTTTITLDAPVQKARYATLLIAGNQANETAGATVAEWVILGQNSTSSSSAQAKRKMSARSKATLAQLS